MDVYVCVFVRLAGGHAAAPHPVPTKLVPSPKSIVEGTGTVPVKVTVRGAGPEVGLALKFELFEPGTHCQLVTQTPLLAKMGFHVPILQFAAGGVCWS